MLNSASNLNNFSAVFIPDFSVITMSTEEQVLLRAHRNDRRLGTDS